MPTPTFQIQYLTKYNSCGLPGAVIRELSLQECEDVNPKKSSRFSLTPPSNAAMNRLLESYSCYMPDIPDTPCN